MVYGASGYYLDEFMAAYPAISLRIRSLHLDFWAWYEKGVELGKTLGRASPLLEHLTLHPNSTIGDQSVTLGPLFEAPRLESLSVKRVNLPDSMKPVPVTTKLCVVSATADDRPAPWMRHILRIFPHLVELQLPNFKDQEAFTGLSGRHRLESLTLGQHSYTVPHRLTRTPSLNLPNIRHVQLFWPTRAVAKERLAADLQGQLSRCEITTTHWNAFTATVSDGRGFLREFTVPYTEFKRFFADSQRVFDTTTSIAVSNALFPDSLWELVGSLGQLERIVIRTSADTGRRLLVERLEEDAPRASPHPSLRSLVIETDTASPPISIPNVERILRSRVGLDIAVEGTDARGVVVKVELR
ncbi:hypothetical protein AURDEDRAFT_113402 [Auricularia subglabra TFB-10046 SS5]|nr:hypothetical protein AURDEDRAFT_113402 [Auricularia subglabra TFB-10046 SS5]